VSDEITANLVLQFNKADLTVANSEKLGKNNPNVSLLFVK